ncbi:MAG TPA: S1C family serine protease [Actinomycetota bacterium]|nr:S1C family serine protease [Actinomycetota bacterium]
MTDDETLRPHADEPSQAAPPRDPAQQAPPEEDIRPDEDGEPTPPDWTEPVDPAMAGSRDDEQTPQQIWDPKTGRWVSEDELREGPRATSPWRSEAPAGDGVPALVSSAVAGVAGAVLAIVALLFFPGNLARTGGTQSRPGASAGQAVDAAASVQAAREWVVNVAVTGASGGDRFGSGIVIDDQGHVATSTRLVDGGGSVSLRGPAGEPVAAEILGRDVVTDVAILRASVPGVSRAVMGTAEFVHLGDPIVLVGSLPGAQTVAAQGVVASIGRPSSSGGRVRFNQIQLDALVMPNSAGGVALDRESSAVGMVTVVAEGPAQIVPIDVVRSVHRQLLDGSQVSHPYTGAITNETGVSGAGRDSSGLAVAVVLKGSPAEKAGLKAGDLIVAIDGKQVGGPLSLVVRTLEGKPGEKVDLSILRGTVNEDLTVTLDEQPQDLQ